MTLAHMAYVDGHWVDRTEQFEVRDPFDGAVISRVTDSDDALVDDAIAAAARAYPGWRSRPGPERGELLARLAHRMLDDEQRLAALCTRENGKPLGESVAEVRYAASFLSWFLGREGSRHGLDDYTNLKYLASRI
ncbi:MAG TPA: aldehyde dehydrogenase family protein [Kofleriaceae bacterium]|nr:aldehyde dehydrogenase family protein [Kofleriaceae bacterium]